jgi:hypothetical protein
MKAPRPPRFFGRLTNFFPTFPRIRTLNEVERCTLRRTGEEIYTDDQQAILNRASLLSATVQLAAHATSFGRSPTRVWIMPLLGPRLQLPVPAANSRMKLFPQGERNHPSHVSLYSVAQESDDYLLQLSDMIAALGIALDAAPHARLEICTSWRCRSLPTSASNAVSV